MNGVRVTASQSLVSSRFYSFLLAATPRDNGAIPVEIKRAGQIYDPTTGEIRSSSTDFLDCWFIDTDYNGEQSSDVVGFDRTLPVLQGLSREGRAVAEPDGQEDSPGAVLSRC